MSALFKMELIEKHLRAPSCLPLSPCTDEVDSFVLVYFLSAALAFTIMLVALLAFSVYKMNKINCQCTGN